MGRHRHQHGEDQGEAGRPVPPPPAPAPALHPPVPQAPASPRGPSLVDVYDWRRDGWAADEPPPAPAPVPPSGRGPEEAPARHWGPLTIGTAGPAFEPRPATGLLSYRPDTVCDGWSTDALALRLASVRGYQHRYDGRPREDDAAAGWEQHTGTVVFAVADGVSDARQPHIGSQLACRSAVDEMLKQARTGGGFVTDWNKLLSTVHWQLREQAGRLLRSPDTSVEETAGLLATTLVAGAATPTRHGVEVTLVSVGDSGAWAVKHDQLYPLTGGKQAGDDGLVSSAVQPLPYVPGDLRPFHYSLDPGTVLLVGTDGFGDPVGDGRGAVAHLFATELRRPVTPLGFAHLLDFSRETFDDDRTLVALWPRTEGPGCAM